MDLRESLKQVGLTDDQASSAESVLRQFVAGEYVPKHRFDEINTKNKELAQELGRTESEKNALEKRAKAAEDSVAPLKDKLTKVEADWKQKYDGLVAEHKKAEEDRILLETYNTRMAAIKSALGDSAYDTDMVTSLIDLESLEVKDGKVMGVEKAIDAIRKEKAFLFKDDSIESTAPTSAPEGKGGAYSNFGEALAKKASETDALTKAAAQKYFG
jgi:chromosome segregation ATPase